MKSQNVRSLESLSLFCHVCGLITVIIGIVIVFTDLINKNFLQIQIGVFVIAVGYAFVKIAAKISLVVLDEKRYQF